MLAAAGLIHIHRSPQSLQVLSQAADGQVQVRSNVCGRT